MTVIRHAMPLQNDELHAYVLRKAGRVTEFQEAARSRPGNLHLLHTVVESVYTNGAVCPAEPAVADALRLGCQALAALVGIETSTGATYTYQLGDGPPATVPLPPENQYLDLTLWRRAFQLGLISRQPDLIESLFRPGVAAVARACGLAEDDDNVPFIELARQLWQTPRFELYPALEACEAVAERCAAKPRPGGLYVQCVTQPYLAAIRTLAGGDAAGINAAFTAALKGHKRYWSSTKKLRQDVAGYVSLPLTSLAALAYDRGVRIEVESDYLPRPWVTGEVFKAA